MRTGTCIYAYNPSEIYQRTKPGQGIETSCGAATWPATDEPELGMVRLGDGTVEYRPTGRSVERAQPDPYCPGHGGSPEPPPPPVSMAELEAGYHQYVALVSRFRAQQAQAIEALGDGTPALPLPGTITADEVTEAARAYIDLASAAAAAHEGPEVTGGQ